MIKINTIGVFRNLTFLQNIGKRWPSIFNSRLCGWQCDKDNCTSVLLNFNETCIQEWKVYSLLNPTPSFEKLKMARPNKTHNATLSWRGCNLTLQSLTLIHKGIIHSSSKIGLTKITPKVTNQLHFTTQTQKNTLCPLSNILFIILNRKLLLSKIWDIIILFQFSKWYTILRSSLIVWLTTKLLIQIFYYYCKIYFIIITYYNIT